jgi:osmoprotectant transport system ATP-binding protein
VTAVEGVNLEVERGELFVLIGPSGSGKTTLLKMVNRLVEPDAGQILIDGNDIATLDPVLLRRTTGYVIQQIGLFPHLTVAGNIGLVPELAGIPAGILRRRVETLLSLVQLPPELFMDRYPRELSGGQQQRVGLARALAMEPSLLLMDEPFGALDPVLRRQLQDEFLQIRARLNKTILFVTHDVEEAFRLGDRVGIVADGKLVQVGAPEDLVMHPDSPAVAALIGAERRIRFFDHLTVKSLMVPIDQSLVIGGDIPAVDGSRILAGQKLEYALVGNRDTVEGIVYLRDLAMPGDAGARLRERVQPLLAFPGSTQASEALRAMKDQGVSIALVTDGSGPAGILVMDEMVRRLL